MSDEISRMTGVYPPNPGDPLTKITHDPVDMVKVDPSGYEIVKDEIGSALAEAEGLIIDAHHGLDTADDLGGETVSWEIQRAYFRVTTQAQLATAQAMYASAMQLREISETLAEIKSGIETLEGN